MPRAATNMFVLCEHIVLQSIIATPFAPTPAGAQQQCEWQHAVVQGVGQWQ